METIEELVINQNVLRSRLDKLIESGRKTKLTKRTQGFYENKVADLKGVWSEYNANDFEINKLSLRDPTLARVDYLTKAVYCDVEIKYSEYMGELFDGLRVCSPAPSSTTPDVSSFLGQTTTIVQQESQLPKIALPKFNGDYDLWRSFHDLFRSLVHNNKKITSVQKLHYLKGCLTGEAEKLLRHTPITDEDYEPAWKKLVERYNNKRILVNHQLKLLVNQSKLTTETAAGIKSLLDTTEECLQQLKSLDVDTSTWDALLIYLLVQKLPFMTLKLWEEEQGASHALPEFKQFSRFMNTRLKVLESIADALTPRSTQLRPVNKGTTQAYHALNQIRCSICSGNHFVQRCSRYRAMNVAAKRKAIKSAGHCLNCLSKRHSTQECTSNFRCLKCGEKHHTSIHDDAKGEQYLQSNNKGSKEDRNVSSSQNQENIRTPNKNSSSTLSTAECTEGLNITQSFTAMQTSQALLATALVRAQDSHGELQTLRCLIDTGSQSSFVTEMAVKRLQAKLTPTSVEVVGLNSSSSATSRHHVKLNLCSCNSNSTLLIEDFLVVKRITDSLPTRALIERDWRHLEGLKLADPTFWRPGTIDALLGAQVYTKIVRDGIRRGSDSAPIAINTIFGWILLGSTTPSSKRTTTSLTVTTPDANLNTQLKRFWETEEIIRKKILTAEEEQCEHIFHTTHRRLSNGKYQVKLPFINDQLPSLGESRPQALKRFKSLQQRFKNDPQLEEGYQQCLNEYIELGHMERANPPSDVEGHYYIPHHAVFKNSSTTKLRVVFDASAKTTNGTSLNQHLLNGPTLQPKLFAILLNWRRYRIAMNADLEKMYRMIEVHPEHRTYQRIIWQDTNSSEPQDFRLKTVTFGTSAAPYLAIRTLQQLADDEKAKWPVAANATKTEFYVDDLLTGADNIEDAKQLQQEMIQMMKAGGFNLRKWTSSDVRLLEELPIEYRELKEILTFNENDSVKTLGLRWHPGPDYFTYVITSPQEHTTPTKRTILSDVAALYDPLGWLSPVTIAAKILIQTLWIIGTSWDGQVTDEIKADWNTFKSELQKLELVKIPRWIRSSPSAKMQLHGFSDASARAYAAVLYLRVEDEHENITTTLITSKTRVAPLKPTTIPRLELNGALLLTNLIQATVEAMQLQNVPITAWTDAMIVLHWIKEHPSKWKTYVANRVVEIQETVRYEQWRHVPTKDNPADLASRSVSASNLLTNELWWHGPTWLSQQEGRWPKHTIAKGQTDLEAKKATTKSLLVLGPDNILLRYSSYTRLSRITATMQRFIYNSRHSRDKKTGMLSSAELKTAELSILRLVQQSEFPDEYKQLLHKTPLLRKSRLLTLNPFMDDAGLIRVGGRLQNAPISYNRKHPIILPRNNHVTMILVDKIHLETLHGGTSLVLNTSRNYYWILDARRCITSRVRKCTICVRHRQAIATQLMGNLPTARVKITKPFTEVGIDYAGPITVKVSNHRNAKHQKAYFCVFVCMVTRAIHIELVSSLTSAAFIAALRRFVARSGLCKNIYSDCGSNFIGAKTVLDKEVRQEIKNSTKEAATDLASRHITWHFNPPAAPHFGGLWEAGVKSIKQHLRRTLGNKTYTWEEYATILAQIEACLNSRPICRTSDSPEDLFVLTAGHFLIGQELNAIPEADNSPTQEALHQRWKVLQHTTKQFWDKWSKDYLNQLQHRPKWCTKQPNIQVGDVVLIKGENMPPATWPLAIIENVHPGTDGLVRVVQVRTKYNTLQRPIAKICQLPIHHREEDTIK